MRTRISVLLRKSEVTEMHHVNLQSLQYFIGKAKSEEAGHASFFAAPFGHYWPKSGRRVGQFILPVSVIYNRDTILYNHDCTKFLSIRTIIIR